MTGLIHEQEVGGITWYVVTRRFETSTAAKEAWDALQAEDERLHRALQLGVYRHGLDAPGAQANTVTAVTHDEHGAEVADAMLDAPDSGLEPELVEALILRRIDVLAAQIDAGQGTVKIRRPEGRGARVYPGGIFEEQIVSVDRRLDDVAQCLALEAAAQTLAGWLATGGFRPADPRLAGERALDALEAALRQARNQAWST